MVKTELPAYEDICLDLVQGYHEYMVAFMEEILRRNVDYAAADATFANWIESVCLGCGPSLAVFTERFNEKGGKGLWLVCGSCWFFEALRLTLLPFPCGVAKICPTVRWTARLR